MYNYKYNNKGIQYNIYLLKFLFIWPKDFYYSSMYLKFLLISLKYNVKNYIIFYFERFCRWLSVSVSIVYAVNPP